ncbi:mechanosensitive ion channel [Candidatus Gracilibacteria bacterium]|nr:mechanosensitive ion channel [Candidatus Gracilibacteria bacterium]
MTEFLANNQKYIDIMTHFLTNFGLKLIIAIVVLYIGFKVVGFINSRIEKALKKAKLDPMIEGFIVSAISILLKIFVLLSAAKVIGIETSSFMAIFAAAGLAVGMALSGTLQNFAGGVMILVLRPYKIGDFISLSGYEGTVKNIYIFNTILLTTDKRTVIIPNADISNGSMINFSTEPIRRLDLSIGIDYSDDIDLAKKTLQEIVDAEDRILDKENTTIAVGELGDNAVIILCRVFVKNADYWTVNFDMLETIKKTFDEKGLNFPFPQRQIHMTKED